MNLLLMKMHPRPNRPTVHLTRFGLLPRFGWMLFGGMLFGSAAFAEQGFDHWRQTDPDSVVSVDHAPWNRFLSRYVSVSEDGINRLSYQSVSSRDHARLNAYIALLENVAVTGLTGEQQLAYWINLYNAITVRVILNHYPVESIRDISFGWFDRGPWKENLATVEGRELSLDDIEQRIVRPIFGDNRVHYALNCASIGCPNLQPRAYTRDNLEELLESGARAYINNPRGVHFDGDELIVSSLFKWYKEDFGQNQRQVIEHLKQYAQPALRQRLERADEIDDFFYDWSLNDG